MEIHIEAKGCDPLFDAINSGPFSDKFKASFINEILTTTGLRFGGAGILGFFDGSDIVATGTGDYITRARLSRAGELMVAALRALSGASEVQSRHRDHPFKTSSQDRSAKTNTEKVAPLALVQQETSDV